MKKSQIISMDLLFAVIIVLSILTVLSVIIEQFNANEDIMQERRDMEIKAQSAMNSLTQTSGNPTYWEAVVINLSLDPRFEDLKPQPVIPPSPY